MSLELSAKIRKEERRLRRLARAQSDSWFLATEILNYGWNPEAGGKDSPFPGKGMTRELHKPICKWYDERRQRLLVAVFIPRWHHKSTLAVVWMIQDFLVDPAAALLYWQSTNDLAEEVVSEVGHHLQHNPKLRELEPIGLKPDGTRYNALPSRQKKKFVLADQFTLNRPIELFSRFPSLVGKGSGTEVTGKHGKKGYLDDIIARNTIVDNQLHVVSDWVESTVLPVIDDAMLRVTGTRWHIDAVYEKWIEDPEVCCIVLPCWVPEQYDLVMNPKAIDWTQDKIIIPKDPDRLRPIYGPPEYRKTQLKKIRFYEKNMGVNFGPQMENDPSPSGEKPWKREHELACTIEEAAGHGFVVTLSDPAPRAVGSGDITERRRKDGTKNSWAICTVKLRRKGDLRQIILLDGVSSKEWGLDEGMDKLTEQAQKWHSKEAYSEHTQSPILLQALFDAKKRGARSGSGWRGTIIHKGLPGGGMQNTYNSGAKNEYLGALADRNSHSEFLICDSCPKHFRDTFLNQARNARPTSDGRTGIPFDDEVNVVAFATDPYFQNKYPQVEEAWSFNPFRKKEVDEPTHGNRHVSW